MQETQKSPPLIERIAVQKSYDLLADQLRDTILAGDIDVGDRLPGVGYHRPHASDHAAIAIDFDGL